MTSIRSEGELLVIHYIQFNLFKLFQSEFIGDDFND